MDMLCDIEGLRDNGIGTAMGMRVIMVNRAAKVFS